VYKPKLIVAPKGWVSLADVAHTIFIAFMNNIQTEQSNPFYEIKLPPNIETTARQYAMVWEVLRIVKDVSLLGPDGKIIEISKNSILLRPDPASECELENWSIENEIFNVSHGTIGSGSLPQTSQVVDGYNILLKKDQVDSALRKLGLTPKSPRGRPDTKREKAGDAYWQLYPNGQEVTGDPWGVVQTKIINEIGIDISMKTVRRAIGPKR
jgi:hypothetical protein